MTMGDFITPSQIGLPVKVIVLNNNGTLSLVEWKTSHPCPLRVQADHQGTSAIGAKLSFRLQKRVDCYERIPNIPRQGLLEELPMANPRLAPEP